MHSVNAFCFEFFAPLFKKSCGMRFKRNRRSRIKNFPFSVKNFDPSVRTISSENKIAAAFSDFWICKSYNITRGNFRFCVNDYFVCSRKTPSSSKAEKIAEFKNPRIAKIAAENRKSFGAFWVRPCARWNGFAIYFAIRKSENAENSFAKENGALRKCAPEFTEIWKRKMVQINSAPLNYSS